MAAPLPLAVNTNSADFNKWRDAAVLTSGLAVAMPDGFGATAQALLKAQLDQEGQSIHARDLLGSLVWNNVDIGQKLTADQSHTFTDGGLGFTKVQPYNAGTYNLYKPDENLTKGASILKGNIVGSPAVGADLIVWSALFKYNRGHYSTKAPADLRNPVLPPNPTPAQQQAAANDQAAAAYADAIFNRLHITHP